ncbi:MAG: hypothetical protein IID39_08275 [Planctomycetes bacterium]|nr:hypothetical protein [Planctomycetota bacterium]
MLPPRWGWGASNQTVVRERLRTVAGDLPIDWRRTIAFCAMGLLESFIYLNDQNPDVRDDRARHLSRVLEAVKAARHTFTGDRLFGQVQTGAERFGGRASSEAWFPDIVARPVEGYTIQRTMRQDQIVAGPPHPACGEHRPEGIYLWRGPHVPRGARGSDARITQIAPTVLALLGIPMPGWMDGRPMTVVADAQDPPVSPLTKEGMRGGAAKELDAEPMPPSAGRAYTDEQRAAIEERLESLGYIE